MHSSRMHTACSSSCLLGGGYLPKCMLRYTPWTWALTLDIPLGVDLETPQARPLNHPPGCEPGDPPPVDRILDTCF